MRVSIPEGYHEITVHQFQQLSKLDKTNNATMSDLERATAGIRILTGIPEHQLVKLRQKDISRIMSFLAWMHTPPPNDLPVITMFEMDGVKYGFQPNWNDITLGEYVDLEQLSSLDMVDNMHRLMAIFYRPVTKEWLKFYTIEPYEPNAMRDDAMKYAPLSAALGAFVFFCNIERTLAINLLRSSAVKETA